MKVLRLFLCLTLIIPSQVVADPPTVSPKDLNHLARLTPESKQIFDSLQTGDVVRFSAGEVAYEGIYVGKMMINDEPTYIVRDYYVIKYDFGGTTGGTSLNQTRAVGNSALSSAQSAVLAGAGSLVAKGAFKVFIMTPQAEAELAKANEQFDVAKNGFSEARKNFDLAVQANSDELGRKLAEILSRPASKYTEVVFRVSSSDLRFPYQFKTKDGLFLSQAVPLLDRLGTYYPTTEVEFWAKDTALGSLRAADESWSAGAKDTAQVQLSIAKMMADVLFGLDPYTGTVRDALEFFSGKNIVTGDELSVVERALSGSTFAISLVTLGAASSLKNAITGMVKVLSTTAARVQPSAKAAARILSQRVRKYMPSGSGIGNLGKNNFSRIIDAHDKWPWGRTPRIMPGDPGTVIVIGRGMDDSVGVKGAVKHLKSYGLKVEIFKPSRKAVRGFKKLKNEFGNQIPDQVLFESQIFKENLEWATKHRSSTIIDIGNPKDLSKSYFHNMERRVLFGE